MSRSKGSRLKEAQRMMRARQKKQNQQAAIRHSATQASGRFKMSDVIEHLAEPLLDDFGDTPEQVERVIMLTIAAWNLTLFPPEKREAESLSIIEKFFPADPEGKHVVQWILNLVAERKRKYYPNLRNPIVDVRFEREPDDTVYFEVAYTPEPPPSP